MIGQIVEATDGLFRGRFFVGAFDMEWNRHSERDSSPRPLLTEHGLNGLDLYVWDLETKEGTIFRHGDDPQGHLLEHSVWVSPLYEPLLAWMNERPMKDAERFVENLPGTVDLPPSQSTATAYRRGTPPTLGPGETRTAIGSAA